MTTDTARTELARLLDLDPSLLDDHVSLRDGLALDSLTMLRVITWLEARGIPITSEDELPATVGELLHSAPRLSVRVGGVPGIPQRFAIMPPRDPLAPVLETPALRLAPLTGEDLGFLYALAIEPETGF